MLVYSRKKLWYATQTTCLLASHSGNSMRGVGVLDFLLFFTKSDPDPWHLKDLDRMANVAGPQSSRQEGVFIDN